MAAIRTYERPLAERLISGLEAIPSVTLYGIAGPARFEGRAPTVAFTLKGYSPRQAAERLGVEESGGIVRVGNPHYIVVVL